MGEALGIHVDREPWLSRLGKRSGRCAIMWVASAIW